MEIHGRGIVSSVSLRDVGHAPGDGFKPEYIQTALCGLSAFNKNSTSVREGNMVGGAGQELEWSGWG